jgi:hypothetical protein
LGRRAKKIFVNSLPHGVRYRSRELKFGSYKVPFKPRVRAKIAQVARARRGRPHPLPNLHPAKLELIDYAAEFLPFQSFADLGGVWHVDGGYSLYALRKGVQRGVLVDEGAHALSAGPRSEQRLEIVEANFVEPETAVRVGEVDAIFHFDTLLHQAAPDWRETLALYAARTNAYLVCQPQLRGDRTIRLADLDSERYQRLLDPPDVEPDPDFATTLQDKRDSHEIWQWGITDDDLIAAMRDLGFGLRFFKSWGRWLRLESFDRQAFVFARRMPGDAA